MQRLPYRILLQENVQAWLISFQDFQERMHCLTHQCISPTALCMRSLAGLVVATAAGDVRRFNEDARTGRFASMEAVVSLTRSWFGRPGCTSQQIMQCPRVLWQEAELIALGTYLVTVISSRGSHYILLGLRQRRAQRLTT